MSLVPECPNLQYGKLLLPRMSVLQLNLHVCREAMISTTFWAAKLMWAVAAQSGLPGAAKGRL